MYVIDRINQDKSTSYRYISQGARVFAIMGLTIVPLAYFVDVYAAPDANYGTLAIRLYGSVVLALLYFVNHTDPAWTSRWENYTFWVFLPMLPFVWGVMMLGTAATSDPAAPTDLLYWVMQYLVALFFFTQIANSPYVAISQYVFGTLAAIVVVWITVPSPNWTEINRVFGWQIGIYLTAVIVGSLANRNPAMARSLSLSAARAVGSNIAHEIRTPLSGIASRAEAARGLLPHLVGGYESAKDAGIDVEPLTKRQLELFESSFADIRNEAKHANVIINMLLVNTSENPIFGQSIDTVSAATLVDDALNRYPYANAHERNLVHQQTVEDFQATVPRLLIDHVIFNLVKNALYYVQNHGSGSVTLSIEKDLTGKTAGTILVSDDGPGIHPTNMPRIYERFFTTTVAGRGSGIGLNFCKMVMDGIGGSITCDSVHGKYTTFRLSIPNSKTPELSQSSFAPNDT